jgi:hypothetical protein
MQYGLESYHPFSQFDLAAIGIVLVLVMAILAFRRVVRMVLGPKHHPARDPEPTGHQNGYDLD